MCIAQSTFTLGPLQQPCPSFVEYHYKRPKIGTDLEKYYLEVEYFALIISYCLATIDILLVGDNRER